MLYFLIIEFYIIILKTKANLKRFKIELKHTEKINNFYYYQLVEEWQFCRYNRKFFNDVLSSASCHIFLSGKHCCPTHLLLATVFVLLPPGLLIFKEAWFWPGGSHRPSSIVRLPLLRLLASLAANR